jgi:hypothetical protein
MLPRLLAVVFTAIGVLIVQVALKQIKGISLKYGAVGMILLLLPHSVGIVTFEGLQWYFIGTLTSAVIGLVILLIDMPKA